MTSVAVILSASSYNDELNRLPASLKDSEAINTIIRYQDRFDEILSLHDEPDTISTKDKIFNFIKRFENTEVDEMFFYFSGHGEFFDNEFFYLMPDYKTSRRRQTSIINSDLDNAVRAIRPKIYTKIVDACHSGVSYIKDANHVGGFLQETKPELKDLYFLFSSQVEEASWQGKNLSYFTSALIGSIVDHPLPTIKYKDIINYVSDEFETTKTQKPFFVHQGSYTDEFCDVTEDLKSKLRDIYAKKNSSVDSSTVKGMSLLERVRRDAANYCDEASAIAILSSLEEKFSDIQLDADFKEIFDISVSKEDRRNLPDARDIGVWIEQKNDRGYFAKPIHVTEAYKKKVLKTDGLFGIGEAVAQLGASLTDSNYKFVTDYRKIVGGYNNTTELPFSALLIKAKSSLPNLPEIGCYIAPLLSRTHMRVFYSMVQWQAYDWVNKSMVGSAEWHSLESPLKDETAVDSLVSQIKQSFVNHVQEPIRAKYNSEQKL